MIRAIKVFLSNACKLRKKVEDIDLNENKIEKTK